MTELIRTIKKLEELTKENKKLRDDINYLTSQKYIDDKLETFVNKWYEKNKDTIDIGEVTICGKYKVDLIPDEMEKRLYFKMLKLITSYYANPPK